MLGGPAVPAASPDEKEEQANNSIRPYEGQQQGKIRPSPPTTPRGAGVGGGDGVPYRRRGPPGSSSSSSYRAPPTRPPPSSSSPEGAAAAGGSLASTTEEAMTCSTTSLYRKGRSPTPPLTQQQQQQQQHHHSIHYGGGGGVGVGMLDTSRGNQFRSNVEFYEKPRQLLVLGAMMAVTVYLGYSHQGGDKVANTRAAFLAVCFTFLTHCFLQCRDTVIIRPHPGVWRVVHGVGMIYLMCMAVLLVQDKDNARELVGIFFEDIGPVPVKKTPGVSEPFQDCALNVGTLKRQVTEIWFVAHTVGWWGKMVMFRDWGVCWLLSVAFEMLECSLQFIIPEFKECWWDSLLIDLLGANLIGMVAGWWTLKVMESNVYDWSGGGSTTSRIRRFINSLSPYSFTRYRWSVFSSFKRFLQVMGMVAICLTMELNAFMLLHTLQLPKASAFNKVRLSLVALLAVPSAAEYYDFITNPQAHRLGQNAWCMIAIMQLEIVVWLKFWPSNFVMTTPPPDVHIPWTITLTLLGMWMFLSLTLVKEEDLLLLGVGGQGQQQQDGNGGLGLAAASQRGGGGSSNAGTPRHHHQSPLREGGGGGESGPWSPRSDSAAASPRPTTTEEDEAGGSSSHKKGVSGGGCWWFGGGGGGQQLGWRVVVHEVVDMVFFLAFLPLIWLVKQWAF